MHANGSIPTPRRVRSSSKCTRTVAVARSAAGAPSGSALASFSTARGNEVWTVDLRHAVELRSKAVNLGWPWPSALLQVLQAQEARCAIALVAMKDPYLRGLPRFLGRLQRLRFYMILFELRARWACCLLEVTCAQEEYDPRRYGECLA